MTFDKEKPKIIIRKKPERNRLANFPMTTINPLTQKVECGVVSVLYQNENWAVGKRNEQFWVFNLPLSIGFFPCNTLKMAKMLCRRLGENITIDQALYRGYDSFTVQLSPDWSRKLLNYDPERDMPDDEIPF